MIVIREKYETKDYRSLMIASLAGISLVVLALLFQSSIFFLDVSVLQKAFFVVSLSEEGFKLLLLYLFLFKNRGHLSAYEFIRSALLTSIVFALIENVAYANIYFKEYGMAVSYLRMFTALPLHAITGISMGFFYSKFFTTRHAGYLFISFLSPFLMHGAYDYFLFIEQGGISIFFLVIFILVHKPPINLYFSKNKPI